MKKSSALLFALIIIMAFSSCGGKEQQKNAATGTAAITETAEATGKTKATPAEPAAAAKTEAERYEEAKTLQSEGKYADALAAFRELGEYEDAAQRRRQCATEAVKAYITANPQGVAMQEETLDQYRLIFNNAVRESVQENESAFIAVNGKEQIVVGDLFESGTVSSGVYVGNYCCIVLGNDADTVSVNCVSYTTLMDAGTLGLFAYDTQKSTVTADSALDGSVTGTVSTKPLSGEAEAQTVTFQDSDCYNTSNARYRNAIAHAGSLLEPMGVTPEDLGIGG